MYHGGLGVQLHVAVCDNILQHAGSNPPPTSRQSTMLGERGANGCGVGVVMPRATLCSGAADSHTRSLLEESTQRKMLQAGDKKVHPVAAHRCWMVYTAILQCVHACKTHWARTLRAAVDDPKPAQQDAWGRASTTQHTHEEVLLLLQLPAHTYSHAEPAVPEQATSRPQLLRPEPSCCYGDACKPAVPQTDTCDVWSSRTHCAQRLPASCCQHPG